MKQYEFIAYAAGTSREMNPSGTDNLKIRREREGENIFFRLKLSGELTFSGEDFAWLRSLEAGGQRCQKVGFRIKSLCAGTYGELIYVYFSLTDAKVDLRQCTMKLGTSIPADLYQTVFDGYAKEYNTLNVPININFPVRIKLDFEADFEFAKILMGQLEDPGRIDDEDTWAPFLTTSYWQDGSLFNKGERSDWEIIFRLVKTQRYENGLPVDLSSDGWQTVEDGILKDGFLYAKYAKKPDLYNFKPYHYGTKEDFNKYSDLIQVDCGQAFDASRYIEVTGPDNAHEPAGDCFPGCIEIRTNADQPRCMRLLWEFGTFRFLRNRRLIDVIHYLVQQSCPVVAQDTADDISEFFTDPINYATGLPNALINILLAAKSDVIGYSSTEAATKAMISLKNLQDELKAQFQVYWFLDDSGKYRLEHYSYFDQSGIIDLTLPKWQRWMNQSYEYDKINMPRYERLKFSEAFNDDFAQGEIEYLGDCVNRLEGQDVKETTVSKFDNDIENLILTAEALNREGFALLVHENGAVVSEEGDISGTLLTNGHLAASNLVKHYYQHGRVLPSGLVNGNALDFKSTLRLIKQDPITIPNCCDLEIDPFATFVTSLSKEGGLLYSEYSLKNNGALTIATLHHIEDMAYVTPDRSFDDSFSESFG
jgi:hypothetical protein